MGQYSTNMVATDVLWSDPVQEPGLANNDSRGVGMLFGPDITKRFLEAHDLRMIVRSHEGPDARFARDDMLSMDSGYTLDHDTEAGAPASLQPAQTLHDRCMPAPRASSPHACWLLRRPVQCLVDCFCILQGDRAQGFARYRTAVH